MKPPLAPLLALSLLIAAAAGHAQDFGMFSATLRTHSQISTSRSASPPMAHTSFAISSRMVAAALIAETEAERGSTRLCWRYVKKALLKAGAVKTYPHTNYAKEAGAELVRNHGFVRLKVKSPGDAPVGAVLVYGGKGAGHVEIRTFRGFVSDYRSRTPCDLPFLGAFAKMS